MHLRYSLVVLFGVQESLRCRVQIAANKYVKVAAKPAGDSMQATEKSRDKRRERGEESRKAILQAAVASIAALGLGNMTLDRVAERAGISRALVVFHFKSKSKLLEAVLNFLGERYADGWNVAPEDDAATSLDRLLRLVDYDIRFAYDNPGYVSAWHAFWGEAKGNMLYHNISFPRDEEYADELEDLISEVIAEGDYPQADIEPITMALSAMLFGVWVESHLNPDPDDCERYRKAVRLFLARAFPRHTLD